MLDFEKLTTSTECYHCEISVDEIHELKEKGKLRKKNEEGWTLEIDRLKPNFEYTADNCAVSCYWCNNAKTDEFSSEEFKSIGREIRKIFKRRLLGEI
jgi:5-methylcytosine-specific restriction endonuclease McrA